MTNTNFTKEHPLLIKIRDFTGFYDVDGRAIMDGDIVLAHRSYVKSDGYKRKSCPDQIRVYFKVRWSNRAPQYEFREVGVHPDDAAANDQYFYRGYPHFESYPESMFWTQDDGKIANEWHYKKIAHLPYDKRYLALYETKVVDQLPEGYKLTGIRP